jgi:hypothetical protein
VAHPRRWPVAEFGLLKLFTVLFWRSPKPLSKSLIPLGRNMEKTGDSIYVVNLSHNGIFYAFGNDAWATYDNNSGAVTLEIERVANVATGAPCYVVTPRGEVVPATIGPSQKQEHQQQREAAAAHSAVAAPVLKLVAQRSDILERSGEQQAWPGFSPRASATSSPKTPGRDPKAISLSGGAAETKPESSYTRLPELERIDNAIAKHLEAARPKDGVDPNKPKEPPPPEQRFQYYRKRNGSKGNRTAWSPDWGREEA